MELGKTFFIPTFILYSQFTEPIFSVNLSARVASFRMLSWKKGKDVQRFRNPDNNMPLF